MASSALLNQLSDEFGNEIVGRIATTIGESPGKIKAALGDMLPLLLGGIATKAQTDEGAHELLDVIHRDHLDSERYEHVADAIKEPGSLGSLMHTGEPLLDTVLPGNSGVISDWVASHAGINPSSSKSLMSLALTLVLGLIGRRVGSEGEPGLKNLLGKPFNFLQDAPSGLAGMVGDMGSAATARAATVTGMSPGMRKARQRIQRHVTETEQDVDGRKWLWPVVLLLVVVALLWYFVLRDIPDRLPASSNGGLPPLASPIAPTAPTAPMAAIDMGGLVEKKLPNGVTLHVPYNSVESRLVDFLEDESQPVDPNVWFTFDRLTFDTNSSTFDDSSKEQLDNVADIMKAYPQVKVRIGGYTDNSGDPQQNLQLSNERARSAMDEIVALGIDPSRMTAKGYGEQHPITDNATEEGREMNRRIDMNVTAK